MFLRRNPVAENKMQNIQKSFLYIFLSAISEPFLARYPHPAAKERGRTGLGCRVLLRNVSKNDSCILGCTMLDNEAVHRKHEIPSSTLRDLFQAVN